MTKQQLNELLEACDKGRLYDFVVNEYWRLEKEDLKNIISEIIWVAEQRLSEDDRLAFEKEVKESLIENRFPKEDFEDEK